jgi:UDP-2,3-diacylglucosamine hydrolase
MSPKPFELLPGALIIADAHYSAQRPRLLELLRSILEGSINASQLILMGDIFDLLFGPIALTYTRNQEAIATLNAIAKKMTVLYLEGNHDFAIEKYFPDIQVIPLRDQPLHVRFKQQDVLLAHGDFGSELSYRFYTTMIRSKIVLALLGFIDTLISHRIIYRLDRYLAKKDDCYQISAFESLVKKRLQENDLLKYDAVIEGHFHQNRQCYYGKCHYINLGAFACNERYFVVKSQQEALELEEFALR